MTNARSDKTSRVYVQDIMKHVKAIEFFFTYNQLLLIWNNFDFDFRM